MTNCDFPFSDWRVGLITDEHEDISTGFVRLDIQISPGGACRQRIFSGSKRARDSRRVLFLKRC